MSFFWADDAGRVRDNIHTGETPSKDFPDSIKIEKREYFRAIREGRGWYLDSDPSQMFALQSIRSWLDGIYEVGISKPSNMVWSSSKTERLDTLPVVAMSTRLFSMMDPVLLPGYSFAIVDEEGEVWFHSEKDKNLQENYFEETDNQSELISAIRGSDAAEFRSTIQRPFLSCTYLTD